MRDAKFFSAFHLAQLNRSICSPTPFLFFLLQAFKRYGKLPPNVSNLFVWGVYMFFLGIAWGFLIGLTLGLTLGLAW